jgi:cytochrome c551/c552
MDKLPHRLIGAALALFAGGLSTHLLAVSKPLELPPETAKLKPSTLAGYAIAAQKCGICHSADYITLQPPGMNQTQWTAEMKKMQHTYGAPIDDTEIKLLGIYLAVTYGDGSSVSPQDRALTASPQPAVAAGEHLQESGADSARKSASAAQSLLASNGCLGCHALKSKIVGPAYHDVATKYQSDPNALSKVEAGIRGGGAGKWGQVPMPPFENLSPAQLKALAEFVLAQ